MWLKAKLPWSQCHLLAGATTVGGTGGRQHLGLRSTDSLHRANAQLFIFSTAPGIRTHSQNLVVRQNTPSGTLEGSD